MPAQPTHRGADRGAPRFFDDDDDSDGEGGSGAASEPPPPPGDGGLLSYSLFVMCMCAPNHDDNEIGAALAADNYDDDDEIGAALAADNSEAAEEDGDGEVVAFKVKLSALSFGVTVTS